MELVKFLLDEHPVFATLLVVAITVIITKALDYK